MIDPKRCTIVKSPLIVNGRQTYTATLTFHVKEDIQAELMPRDLKDLQELEKRVEHRLHQLVFRAIYGDLLPPVLQLLALAQKNAPNNYRDAVNRNAAVLIELLKLRIAPRVDAAEPVALSPSDPAASSPQPPPSISP